MNLRTDRISRNDNENSIITPPIKKIDNSKSSKLNSKISITKLRLEACEISETDSITTTHSKSKVFSTITNQSEEDIFQKKINNISNGKNKIQSFQDIQFSPDSRRSLKTIRQTITNYLNFPSQKRNTHNYFNTSSEYYLASTNASPSIGSNTNRETSKILNFSVPPKSITSSPSNFDKSINKSKLSIPKEALKKGRLLTSNEKENNEYYHFSLQQPSFTYSNSQLTAEALNGTLKNLKSFHSNLTTNNILSTIRRKGISKNCSQKKFKYTAKNFNCNSLNQKQLIDLEKQLLSKDDYFMPNIQSKYSVNNWLIRDFSVGDKKDPIESSRRKFKVTNEYLQLKEEKQLKKIQMISDRIEKLLIENYDKKEKDEPQENVNSREGFYKKHDYDSLLKEIEVVKKRNEEKLAIEINENSRKLADLILEIDCGQYEKFDQDENAFLRKSISKKNIERTVRLRNILKTKNDPRNDNLILYDVNEFKNQKRDIESQAAKIINKIGAPSFMKTRFKQATIQKFRVTAGNLMGC
jgi:hypothetical protein